MLKTNVQEIEPNKVALTVEVGKEKVDAAYTNFFHKAAQNVNIPGFRRGKVPRPVLVKYIGPEAIKEQISDELVHEIYPQAIKEAKIHPIAIGKIDNMDLKEGETFTFKAIIEVQPKLPQFSYTARKAFVKRAEVTDESINKVLQKLREQFGKLVPQPEGTLEFNDYFIGKIEAKVDGQIDTELSEEKAYKKFTEDTVELLPLKGMKTGETKTFSHTPNREEDKDSAYYGKTIEYTVAVNNISRPVLSDLNDDFAREVGEFKSLDELKTKIREDLEQRFKNDADHRAFDELVDQINKEIHFDVPEAMVNKTIDYYIDSLERKWKQYGTSIEDYLKKAEKSMDEFRATFKEKALYDTRIMLITDEIADRQNFEVTEAEFRAEAERRAAEYRLPVEKLMAYFSEGEGKHHVENQLLRDKIFDFLLKNNEIQYDMVKEEDINKGEAQR